ncbi:unnamed protein product [Eretmochelys imbricata]
MHQRLSEVKTVGLSSSDKLAILQGSPGTTEPPSPKGEPGAVGLKGDSGALGKAGPAGTKGKEEAPEHLGQ